MLITLVENAASIAVQTVHDTATRVAEVRFVLFSRDAFDAFDRALQKLT